jgi:4-amino-4-deoxy-L-arabinose transferase-like glycosyltransferase
MDETATAGTHRVGLGRGAWVVAALGLAVHLGVNLTGGYGIFRDELYYLACADRLDWGYVDQPPLSIVLLAAARALIGDSVFAIRLLPALCAFALILLTGRIARDLGGGGWAEVVATVAALASPTYLGICGFYSMNAFDLVFWAACLLVVVRIAKGGDPRLWIPFGLLAGFAFENKIGIAFLGAGVVVALLATPLRNQLVSRWLWLGVAVGAALATPYLLWQVSHGFPTLEFMRNATGQKNAPMSPIDFGLGQLMMMHPLTALVWLPGLVYLLAAKRARPFRPLGIAYLVVFLVFALQNSKPYYLAGFYPVLFAAGGVVVEGLARRRALRSAPLGLALVVGASGLMSLPLALPVLPPETFVRYANAIGVPPGGEERDRPARLGQHYADMFGWRELAETVARVYDALSPEERAKCAILARNYGQAAAIEYFGRAHGLPKPISGHNSYWLWGPGDRSSEVMIVIGGNERDYQQLFESYEVAAVHDHPYAREFERNLRIYVCRGGKRSLRELWPEVKRFI